MEDKKHEMLCLLKDLSSELGKIPTRAEFESRFGGGGRIGNLFGGYSNMLKSAGLDTYEERRSVHKSQKNLFVKDIEKHIDKYRPQKYIPPKYEHTWASISDMHWPFHSQRVIDKFIEYVKKNKPEYVILNGDAWDMYSHSKFPRSHNLFTPREEREMCLKLNREFWKSVKKVHPTAHCYQLLGNHDLRPLKRILEVMPSAEDWAEEMMRKDFEFDGVVTILDPRQELFIDKQTAVFHGYRTQLGAHRDFTLMSCINGHTHRGGVVFRQMVNTVLFECNSGFAGDPYAKGLSYTPQNITTWTFGFSAGDEYGPRFIPA